METTPKKSLLEARRCAPSNDKYLTLLTLNQMNHVMKKAPTNHVMRITNHVIHVTHPPNPRPKKTRIHGLPPQTHGARRPTSRRRRSRTGLDLLTVTVKDVRESVRKINLMLGVEERSENTRAA